MQPGPILAGVAAAAVVALTVQPLRAVGLMQQAQQAAVQHRSELAVGLLRSAAAVDPLDPLPLKTAAFLRYRLGQTDPARALEHFRDYVALSRAAVQRNPLDHGFWRSLALANMFLATATGDFSLVDEAIRDMQRSLELNPQWPAGRLELARMAAIEGDQPDRPTLLRTALDATDKALALEDGRPENVPAALTAQERAELLAMREQVLRRLQATAVQPATTHPSR
jgi:tetratricopeptide (TPR) repeat protein